tara:strand:+ start:266 stop:745 length:480 start_codon:yes stop_codon:yes gene_type:complete
MENKKRFYIYNSWKEAMELLSTEEKAIMLMNLFKYNEGAEPILNTSGLKLVWAGMRFLLEKDSAKYKAAVQRGKNAASKRQLTAPQSKSLAPQIDLLHDIDNDNVNDNDNDKVNENDNKSLNVTSFDTFITPDIPNPLTGVTESERKAIKSEEFDKMFE